MKKVALLKKHLSNAGGLEKQMWRIAKAFADAGASPVLVSKDAQAPAECPYEHRSVSHFDAHLLDDYDVVLGIDRLPFQTHIRAGNGVHAAYLDRRQRFLDRWRPKQRKQLSIEQSAISHPRLRHIITNSEMVKSEYIHHYGVDPKMITAIHNGVEFHELQAPFERSLEHPHGPYGFLFVGNDFKRKGLLPLLHALSHLRKKEWQLTIVGHDKRASSYRTLAKGLGIDHKVAFVGKRSAVPYYEKADCLVLPTLYDPFANVTLEALAMGLFVVTSPFNGAHEILTPESGIVASNAAGLRDALMQCLTSARDPKAIRQSVSHLDFSQQLKRFTQVCLTT